MNKIKENYKFYDLNRDAINAGHIKDYVIIWNGKVLGYSKDLRGAYDLLNDTDAEPGDFMIHECLPEDEDIDDIGYRVPVAYVVKDW